MVRAASDVGTIENAQRVTRLAMRRGRMIKGKRINNDRKVERQMVPSMGPVACMNEARTTVVDDGAGTLKRWKYHCETVAAVVALCTPAITPSVQR